MEDEQKSSLNMKQEISLAINVQVSKGEELVNHTDGDDNVDVDYLDSFPPGYRFCPRDEELVLYYLKRKVMNLPLPQNRIMEVKLYSYNPERLTEQHKQYGEKEWYFFTPRDKKYRNGTRPSRSAGDGYWKATGADREVRYGDRIVGYRKALVFYKGKPPKGNKTSWIMHEYRVNDPPSPKKENGDNDMRLDDVVLCRIYKKADKSGRTQSKNHEDLSPPLIQNEDTNDQIIASDDTIDSSNYFDNIEGYMNQILPEESLNNFQQIFNEQFPSPCFSTQYMHDKFGQDDFWSSVGNLVDYPSQLDSYVEPVMNLDLSNDTSKDEFRKEGFQEEEYRKEYKRKFYG